MKPHFVNLNSKPKRKPLKKNSSIKPAIAARCTNLFIERSVLQSPNNRPPMLMGIVTIAPNKRAVKKPLLMPIVNRILCLGSNNMSAIIIGGKPIK